MMLWVFRVKIDCIQCVGESFTKDVTASSGAEAHEKCKDDAFFQHHGQEFSISVKILRDSERRNKQRRFNVDRRKKNV